MQNIDKRTLPKSIETIKRISETKTRKNKEEILNKAKNFKIQQSNIELAKPTHRKRKFITIQEYQSFLKQGRKMSELNVECLKGLIFFYNSMLKGKIQLSKEKFTKLYNKGITLDEIATRHNIRKDQMCFLREYYGIKRKGARYQKRLVEEKPLSQEAKNVIIGSLLGDGHISGWGDYREKHSETQVGYLEWKASFFPYLINKKSFTARSYFMDKRNEKNKKKLYTFAFRTTTHSFIQKMEKIFYKEKNNRRIKIIPLNIADYINRQVLAIWFMDDGSTDWGYRNGVKKYKNLKPSCKISTQGFSIEDVNLLINIINKNWGLNTYLGYRWSKKQLREMPIIRMDADSSVKFINIVKPYILSELKYKINEQEYLKHIKYIRHVNKEKILLNFRKKHNITNRN